MTGAFGEEAMGDWMSLEALRELVEATHLNCSLNAGMIFMRGIVTRS
jgi:hypothetical protein